MVPRHRSLFACCSTKWGWQNLQSPQPQSSVVLPSAPIKAMDCLSARVTNQLAMGLSNTSCWWLARSQLPTDDERQKWRTSLLVSNWRTNGCTTRPETSTSILKSCYSVNVVDGRRCSLLSFLVGVKHSTPTSFFCQRICK